MTVLSIDEFLGKLDKGATLKLAHDKDIFEISQIFDLVQDEASGGWTKNIGGYKLIQTNTASNAVSEQVFADFAQLQVYLSRYDLLTGESVEVDDKKGRGAASAHYDHDSEYENGEFDELLMRDVLTKYSDCDTFSLSAYATSIKISQKHAKIIVDNMIDTSKDLLHEIYQDGLKKCDLPPFDTLVDDIMDECKEFINKNYDKYNKLAPGIGSRFASFIADEVGKTTKYSEPQEIFWHIYYVLGRLMDQTAMIQSLVVSDNEADPLDEVDLPDYDELRPYLVKSEISDGNHCTMGPLFHNVFFELNDSTKKWLLKRREVFDFEDSEYQDFALYEGGKVVFSTCTHEQMISEGDDLYDEYEDDEDDDF